MSMNFYLPGCSVLRNAFTKIDNGIFFAKCPENLGSIWLVMHKNYIPNKIIDIRGHTFPIKQSLYNCVAASN